MKPALVYYGGKIRLAKKISNLARGCNDWELYAEPFAGGAAVYFELPPKASEFYALNDINQKITHFYEVGKSRPRDLVKLTRRRGLYSQQYWRRAREIWRGAESDELEAAWAVWYLSHTCYAGILGGSFSRPLDGRLNTSHVATMRTYLEMLPRQLDALQYATIENLDFRDFMERYGRATTLFYVDSPYVAKEKDGVVSDVRRGHYDYFTGADFAALLDILAKTKARFIMSHYHTTELSEWAAAHGFNSEKIETYMRAGAMSDNDLRRTELLVWNFQNAEALL